MRTGRGRSPLSLMSVPCLFGFSHALNDLS
jgi:hypothetical protein